MDIYENAQMNVNSKIINNGINEDKNHEARKLQEVQNKFKEETYLIRYPLLFNEGFSEGYIYIPRKITSANVDKIMNLISIILNSHTDEAFKEQIDKLRKSNDVID